ncbi:hypothetical protein RAD15_13890 [Bradyrhizobium sp. 14AA]
MGFNIFATADIPITEKGFADVKVIAVTLMARKVANLKAALLLVEAKPHRRILDDHGCVVDMSHSRAGGQDIFGAGVDLDAGISGRRPPRDQPEDAPRAPQGRNSPASWGVSIPFRSRESSPGSPMERRIQDPQIETYSFHARVCLGIAIVGFVIFLIGLGAF